MSSFFTQEYEGREGIDISLIPWISHRGFFSALMHCIYNPNAEEFIEWGEAAERETWKYIPAIKSHIAEEVTLDRCVQRLRKRVMMESWEEKQQQRLLSNNDTTMADRVPSFYTSRSLINLGGLAIGDQTSFSDTEQVTSGDRKPTHPYSPKSPTPAIRSFKELQNGWGGMGLRGNQSSGSLNRTYSGASGLYLMDEDSSYNVPTQEAGETSATPMIGLSMSKSGNSLNSISKDENCYVKTSSMANFYYRKSKDDEHLRTKSYSYGELAQPEAQDRGDSRSQSLSHLETNINE